MSASALITRYGLAAIGIGAGVEGEPFALAGGVFARTGTINPWLAVLAAIAGAFAVDQFWFLFSRLYRDHRLVRSIARRPGFARALTQIEHRSTFFIVMFRFAYGIRAVAPVALGLSAVRYPLYLVLNLCSACAWGALYILIGYMFGGPIGAWYAHASRTEIAVALALLALASVAAVVVSIRSGDAGTTGASTYSSRGRSK